MQATLLVSGLIESARKRLDVVGIFMVMFLSAFGGGTLRDLVCSGPAWCCPPQPVFT
jgi:uncharacterized membrane protein YeiH